jgi:predicted enzyme related to lactoylglutathione lyase
MPKVTGIGGTFFRAKDPKGLARWYEEHLGVGTTEQNGLWTQEAGPSVFSTFAQDTEYFGRLEQVFMLNFRVDDLEGFLALLAQRGIQPVKPMESWEGIGAFAWIEDPEGNRIELWQPAS